MERNEKITLVLSAVVSVGSVALFAAARMKARAYIWNTKLEKNDTIESIAVTNSTPTA